MNRMNLPRLDITKHHSHV